MATKTVQLQCDRCPAVRQGQPMTGIEVLRGQLRSVGWLCRDGVDVCPVCRTREV